MVGKGELQVVDTFFQTESGSFLIAPLAGTTPMKPGCCTLLFFGVDAALLDPYTGNEIADPDTEGTFVLKHLIPSMARTIWRDHSRFMSVYYEPYPGYYFSGDGAIRDKDGYYWIRGRVDDVINVAAHRFSTAEIEAALPEHPGVAEVAVIGVPDELTGQAIAAFVSLKLVTGIQDAAAAAREQIARCIGKFAAPKHVVVLPGLDLPKNRAGKIVRRLLRSIWGDEMHRVGDTSTLVNPACIDVIKDVLALVKYKGAYSARIQSLPTEGQKEVAVVPWCYH